MPASPFDLINPLSGEVRKLRVAGVMSGDCLFNGPMVGEPFAASFLGSDAPPSRHYVALKPGVDADDAAARLEGALVALRRRSIVDRLGGRSRA